MIKKLLLTLVLLMSSAFAQTMNFTSAAYGVNNPPTAFSFGLFNPVGSGVNIVLTDADVSVGFDSTDTTPYLIVGSSIARTLPTGGTCTGYPIINLDLTEAFQITNGRTNLSRAMLIGQPCTSNVTTGNFSADTWVTNLNHTVIHYENRQSITIPPGLGFVIYLFVDGGNMKGNITEGFTWKECPVGSSC